jgi:hypothetical protein
LGFEAAPDRLRSHTTYGGAPAVYFARLLLSYPILLIPCCNFCMSAAQILFPMIWIRLFFALAK